MNRKILLVDDDRNILSGYQRVLRKSLEVDVALGGEEALQRMEQQGHYAVIVADMQMPGMSGLELLAVSQDRYPESIRIMLTGNTDQQTAADAVNHGRVFRFLTKPCTPQVLELAIEAGLRQYELVHAEQELLEGTLTGAIEVLSELLASVDPSAFSLGLTVRTRCSKVGKRMGCPDLWALEVAAMLAPIGRIALPREVLKADQGSPEVQSILARVPEVGGRMLESIPRMESVAEIIRYQGKGFDGSGVPEEGLAGAAIPLGARILRAVSDFTALEASRRSREVALEALKMHARAYDPTVIAALDACFGSPSGRSQPPELIRLRDLAPGMILAADLATGSGQLVLGRGLRLGPGHLELLRNLQGLLDLPDQIPTFNGLTQE